MQNEEANMEMVEGTPTPEVQEQPPESAAIQLLMQLGLSRMPARFWYKSEAVRNNRHPKEFKYEQENARRVKQIASGKIQVSPEFIPRPSHKVILTD